MSLGDVQDRCGREDHGLARVEVDDGFKDFLEIALAILVGLEHCSKMSLQYLHPIWRCEAVHNCHGAQIEEFRREGWLLSGDYDAGGKVPLLSDDLQDIVGEVSRGIGSFEELHHLS